MWPFRRTTRAETGATTRRQIVVVGFDLGTSGIKAAFRDATDLKSDPAVIDFGTNVDGYGRFCYPSVIAIDNGELKTGEAAERRRRAGVPALLSVKRLALSADFARPSGFSAALASAIGRSAAAADVHEFAMTTLAEDALRRILECVHEDAKSGLELHLLCNMDVPMSRIEGPESERFTRVLRSALTLARAPSASGIADRYQRWQRARENQAADHALRERTEMVPEAEAVMAGLAGAVRQPSHTPHAVVDIGAGTSDIGIFWFNRWESIDQIVFLSTGTLDVGVDDLDHAIARQIACDGEDVKQLADGLRAVRCTHTVREGVRTEVEERIASIDPEVLADCVEDVGRRIRDAHIAQWRYGYTKFRQAELFSSLRIITVGGGSLVAGLDAPLAELGRGMDQIVKRVHRVRIGERTSIRTVGRSQRRPDEREVVLLIAALGLSYASIQRRLLIRPHEIPPLPPRDRGPTGPYDFEIDLYE